MKDNSSGSWKRWGPEIAVLAAVVTTVVFYVALGTPSDRTARFVLFLGRFHPLAVHLPIGILVLVTVAESLSLSKSLRPRVDPAMAFMLPVLVAASVGSFFLGQLLASGGGFAAKLVATHRSLTFAAVLGTALCWAIFRQSERVASGAWRAGYRAALFGTVTLLSIGAHYGGSITRGEGYLTKYAPEAVRKWLGPEEPKKPAGEEREAVSEPLVFEHVVLPILKERCVECHGPEMAKGGLRVDSREAIGKGGESGKMIRATGAESPLVVRMRLPVSDEEHMPPDGKEGPTEEEIALIEWWLDRGASDTLRVRDALVPPASRSVLERTVTTAPSAVKSAPTSKTSSSAKVEPGASSLPPVDTATASASSSAGPMTSAPPSGDPSLWSARVAPILASRCGSCHAAAKQKGKLRVDSIAALTTGGKSGPAVVPGSSSGGTLLARVNLPLENEKHMPPREEPQMTASEIALVSFWIDHGADDKSLVSSLPAELKSVVASSGPKPPPPTPPPTPPTASTSTTTTASTGTPTSAKPPDLSALPPTISMYRHVVAPLLSELCSTCHFSMGPAGGLDVEDFSSLMKGGDGGPVVVAGDPAKSPLIQRMRLPLRDSDHMPPSDMHQPKKADIAAIELWIKTGAKEEDAVSPADLTPDIQRVLVGTFPKAKAPSSGTPGPAPSASASATPSASSSGAPETTPSATPSASGRTTPPGASATASATRPVGDPRVPQTGPARGCATCTAGGVRNTRGALALAIGGLVLALRRFRRR